MGPRAEDILNQLTLSAADMKKFNKVISQLDNYFAPQTNTVFERAKLNQRVQKDGETVEQFITSLYQLADTCGYTDSIKREHIRDRIVCGIKDKTLSKELQLKADLTLSKAIELARHHELVSAQSAELNGAHQMDEVKKHQGRNNQRRHQQSSRPQQSNKPPQQQHRQQQQQQQQQQQHRPPHQRQQQQNQRQQSHCMRCGKSHSRDYTCRAASAQCHTCGKIGHFSVVCRQKNKGYTAGEIQSNEPQPESESFLGVVQDTTQSRVNNNSVQAWITNVKINGEKCAFKIDTGADVSVMSEYNYNRLQNPPKLRDTNTTIRSYAGVPQVVGVFETGDTFLFEVFVVKGAGSNLLSRAVSEKLGLVTLNVNEIAYGLVKCAPVKITLRDDAQPYHVNVARRVPIPLMPKVAAELTKMEEAGIIRKITEPTDWCAPMVVVNKKDGGVRLCIDLKGLNKNIKRERYQIPTIDDILPKLANATVFSKLDAASGYYQLPLDPESAKLTTFITPQGRYCFQRLPFGISSASEIFQREMNNILEGIDCVAAYQDDIVTWGKSDEDHESNLQKVLNQLKLKGLKLNDRKCEYRKTSIKFLGHKISKNGVEPDDEKIAAILEMKPPTNVSELRTVLGMINYLGRFIPNLSHEAAPMNMLLRKDTAWSWDNQQQKSFEAVKRLVTQAPTLAYYDVTKETIVSADASSYGIGGYIYQIHEDGPKPIAFCSRTLTPTERSYGQIDKECLASVWACERFKQYLTGLPSFQLISDHRPLIPLINSKDITHAPTRCQRLLMRLMRFNPVAVHSPGKNMHVADALSRSPLPVDPHDKDIAVLQEDVEAYVAMIEEQWPATSQRMQQIRDQTAVDPDLQQTIHYTLHGWPSHGDSIPSHLHAYHSERSNLTYSNGILTFRDRIVIPTSMRSEIINALHEGHWGITKCKDRATQSVWWPGVYKAITNKVTSCAQCTTNQSKSRKEPLITRPLPEYPWHTIAVDLFEVQGKQYIAQMDTYSRFIEIAYLPVTTADAVIAKIKNSFARFGIAQQLLTDNGPQFTSAAFRKFAETWQFRHTTSSPHYPQSNGAAESGVKIAKKIVSQADPQAALLSYHSTKMAATGISPAEALYGRLPRTKVPCLPQKLASSHHDPEEVRASDDRYKERMAESYDRRHGVRAKNPMMPGERVRLRANEKDWSTTGIIKEQVAPRSYIVTTDNGGEYRRTSNHILNDYSDRIPPPMATTPTAPDPTTDTDTAPAPNGPPPGRPPSEPNAETPIQGDHPHRRTTTMSGRTVRPVTRMSLEIKNQ